MNRDDVRETLEEIAPPAPPCFEGRGVWMRWLVARSESHPIGSGSPITLVDAASPAFNHSINFCADCTLQHRTAMLKQDRCRPDAVRAFEQKAASAYLSPFLSEIWLAVATLGKAMTASEYRRTPEVADIAREYRGQVKAGLDKLCDDGYLRRTNEGGSFQPRYWFSDTCRVPRGCMVPTPGAAKATSRAINNVRMPIDTTPLMRPMAGPAFDFQEHPSRRGNRLVYRSGLITDLDGCVLQEAQ